MASEAEVAARCGIGARLRSAREKKGLTILQAAEKLHLDARVLDFLEAEDFASLDAPVYVRGHLRRYAELVGESPAELQQLYAAAAPAPGPDLTRIPHLTAGGDSSRLVMPSLLVLGAFALAAMVWWLLTLPSPKPQPISAGPPAAQGTPAASPPASESTAVGARTDAAPSLPAPAPGTASLNLRFAEPSWFEVYDARGVRLSQGLADGDSARTLSGAPPLRVVLGNAPGVALQLNGQPVILGGLVRHNGSAYFLLDRSGHAAPVPPVMAHGG